jgi:hypothetical protein
LEAEPSAVGGWRLEAGASRLEVGGRKKVFASNLYRADFAIVAHGYDG